ncbi:MAG: hypothetical protein A4E45_02097 [Methanosaeta sp. PtaB.Bin039]|nr:MAG: hypothetical protein A4E45_02097 [Methanosaeta sp. PtaB.Bin039]
MILWRKYLWSEDGLWLEKSTRKEACLVNSSNLRSQLQHDLRRNRKVLKVVLEWGANRDYLDFAEYVPQIMLAMILGGSQL